MGSYEWSLEHPLAYKFIYPDRLIDVLRIETVGRRNSDAYSNERIHVPEH